MVVFLTGHDFPINTPSKYLLLRTLVSTTFSFDDRSLFLQ